jgi:hypothetical protein
MTESPEVIVARYLTPGESTLWSGRPAQGLLLRPSDALYIPFSLLWGGFAVFWEYNVVTSDAPFFFRLWGVPFVLVGLYLVFGRFIVDAYVRARTCYGLTNQRVLILTQAVQREVKSLSLKSLSDVSLTERANGSGTITFGADAPWWSTFVVWPGFRRGQAPLFELIPDARRVFDQIRAAQGRA